MDLGLNTLSDDQLVELARSIATEIARRDPAVADAAQAAIREEIGRARASQDNIWAKKKWLAKMVTDHIGQGCELTVWRASDRDTTRVYLDVRGSDRRGRDAVKWCLHVTGDSKHPPGSLTCDVGSRASKPAPDSLAKIICQHAIKAFSSVRIDCDQAAATHYDVPPQPDDLTERLAAIAAKKEKKDARDAYLAQHRARLFDPIDADEKPLLAAHNVKYDFQLPKEVRDPIAERRAAAIIELKSITDAYDAEHGV